MTHIIPLKLSYSNAYLLKGRKTILVDTGAPREGVKILRALAQLNIAPKDFSLILHTHAHFDHAGSTRELKRWIDVPTAVHAADAPMLSTGRMRPLTTAIGLEAKLLRPLLQGMTFPPVKADMVLAEEMSLKDFGVEAKIIFTPGHTAGSLSVLFPNGEAIVGDLMMGGSLGGALSGSQPHYHYFAEDIETLRASIRKIMSYKPKRFYVGHGGPLEAEAVRQFFARDIQL